MCVCVCAYVYVTLSPPRLMLYYTTGGPELTPCREAMARIAGLQPTLAVSEVRTQAAERLAQQRGDLGKQASSHIQ